MSHHEPFRVTITLRTPACLRPDLTLDAVLAAAIYLISGDVERAHSDIPLARTKDVWHASSIQFLGGERSSQPYIARLDSRDLVPVGYSGEANRKGRININISGGYLAAQLRKLPTFIGQVAFDGNGDIEEVKSLLHALPGLGKNTRQGLGRMGEIVVASSLKDVSVIREDGLPARPTPVTTWEQWGNNPDVAAKDHVAWQPPYWRHDQDALCVVPTGSR
ncbi:MAG: hypothetical protein ACRER5_03105 [Pseudomonas sp.]